MRLLVRLLPLAVLSIFGGLVWREYRSVQAEKRAEVEELQRRAEEERQRADAERARREVIERVLARMTEERVLADVVVLDQATDVSGSLWTTIRLHLKPHPGGDDKPAIYGPFTVQGDRVYFEALTLRFQDRFLEEADARRGRSLVLLTRVFGEKQRPEDGFPVEDASVAVPHYYRLEDPELVPFERELWSRFWWYANHREQAGRDGVEVAWGQAPFTRADPRVLYEIVVDRRGNLVIRQKL